MIDVPHKTCRRCGKVKPLALFVRNCRSPDGHGNYCYTCANAMGHKNKNRPKKGTGPKQAGWQKQSNQSRLDAAKEEI